MVKRLKLKHQLYFLVLLTLVMCCLTSILYYFSFSRITYNRAEETAQQMLEQVVQNVEDMTLRIEGSAKGLSYNRYVQEILISQDRVRNVELYDYVLQIVSAAKYSNNAIYSVNFISDEFRKISDPIRDGNGVAEKLHEKYNYTDDGFRQSIFSSVVQGQNQPFYYFGYIFPIYSLYGDYSKIGCGVFTLDTRELENLVKVNNITENSLFVILDQDNNVVVANRDLKTGDIYQDIFWEEDTTEHVQSVVEYKEMESIAQCMSIGDMGWKVVSIIPREELSSDMQRVVTYGIVLVSVSVILLLIFGHLIIRNITRPINAIVNFLKQTETNALKQRLDIPVQNEIAIIASNMNNMLDRVENMTHKIVENQTLLYEAKLAEQDAELVALQSQINPHFLYNTLNCLSNIGLAYDIPEVADISVAMSSIYRYSIKGDNMVCLSDEIQCIKEYMKIMDVRFVGKFETIYKIDDSLMNLYTLRMILQPVVENAVYHGMERRSGKGKLIIEGKISDDDRLIITVQDDGKGMTGEQLDALRKTILDYENVGLYRADKTSIGLSNINKRIKIQFGNQYGLHITSEEGVGTKVTLILPVKYEK